MEALTNQRDVIAWITSLPPEGRVRTWAALTDPETTAKVAEIVDQTIYMATREAGGTAEATAKVADGFGMTYRQAIRAITRHNARKKARAATINAAGPEPAA